MSSKKSKAEGDIPQWSETPSIIQHLSREELINCIGNNWDNNGDIRLAILQAIKDKTEPPSTETTIKDKTEPPSTEITIKDKTEPPNTETEVSTETKLYKRWSESEDQTLRKAIEVEGEKFDIISSKHFHNKRTEAQCSHRWNKNLKTTLKPQNEWTKKKTI